MVSTLLSVKKIGRLLSLLALAALGSCGQRVAAPVAPLVIKARPAAAPLPVHVLAEKMTARIDSTEAALETGWANSASQLAPGSGECPAPKPQPKQALMQAHRPTAASQAGA